MSDKTEVNALTSAMQAKRYSSSFTCIMLVETTHLTQVEYYISLVDVRVFTFVLWVRGGGFVLLATLWSTFKRSYLGNG